MSLIIKDAGLGRVLMASENLTSRSAKSLVMTAAIYFAQSARKVTKQMRKNKKRDIVQRESLGKQKMWDIVFLKQNQPATYVITSDKDDPRRKITTGGSARNSWNGVLKKLNKASKVLGTGSGMSLGFARKKLKGNNPEVIIYNNLNYLSKINPGIENFAMGKAKGRMEHNLDRVVKRKLKRLWK